MDLANKEGGIVVGTGDLSELALGWCTYNGDQTSMYGVNGGVPKTLMRAIVSHCAKDAEADLANVLRDILDTPVSPELVPPKDGVISQKTEEIVGPYELHDFFLYYTLRRAFPPRKVFRLAQIAFDGSKEGAPAYDAETISKWQHIFYKRFFSQQYKRANLPDGGFHVVCFCVAHALYRDRRISADANQSGGYGAGLGTLHGKPP